MNLIKIIKLNKLLVDHKLLILLLMLLSILIIVISKNHQLVQHQAEQNSSLILEKAESKIFNPPNQTQPNFTVGGSSRR